jgi:ethanolamine transporter
MSHLTGITLIPSMPPLLEAMETVSSICIVMLGSMPLAELIQRIMKVPFTRIREKTGLNGVSTTALLLGMVSTTPTLAMIPDMDKRGKVLCSACLVSYVGLFSAHLAFAMQFEPDMIPALLAAKTVGAIIGGTIALLSTRNTKE